MSLEPVGRFLRRRIAGTDQDLLAGFQDTLAGAIAVEQVGPRMAELVAAATGAARVEVWVVRPEGPNGDELAARWPVDAEPIDSTRVGVQSDDVRHAGELIGRLLRDRGEGGANSPVEDRLVAALVAQAGVALRTVVLTKQLQHRVSESTARAAELRASRQRIVAAADFARHRLERDVHDGAQQHLVGLAVNLSLAATVSIRDPARAAGLIKDLKPAASNALTTLDELSLGIYPRLLAGSGIAAALRNVVATSAVRVSIHDGTGFGTSRFPPEVEAAAYFTCLEAVQNAAKHASASTVWVRLSFVDGALELSIRDDGSGFEVPSSTMGAGLRNIRDRIESLGGRLTLISRPGAGTMVGARIPATPVDDTQPGNRSAHAAP